MRGGATSSLARAVMFVGGLALLPTLLVALGTEVGRRREAAEDFRAQAAYFVDTVAERQILLAEGVRMVLLGLERSPAVRGLRAVESTKVFRGLLRQEPLFANIFTISPSGGVIASGRPATSDLNLADSPFLLRAERSGIFSPGIVVDSPFGQGPVIQFAQPLIGKDGAMEGYLGAALKLSQFHHLFEDLEPPAGGAVYLLDTRGTLASAIGDDSRIQGKFLGGRLWDSVRAHTAPSGIFDYKDETGRRRTVAYRHIVLGNAKAPYLYVVFQSAHHRILDGAGGALIVYLLFFVVALLPALWLGVLLIRRAYGEPIAGLLEAADRLSAGYFRTRVRRSDLYYGEFAVLAEEFNAMASALEARSRELAEARDATAAKAKAKGEFFANLTHELRTPMNAIIGLAELARKAALPKPLGDHAEKILVAGRELLRLINDILDLSKIEAGRFDLERVPFDLETLLRGLEADFNQNETAEGALRIQRAFRTESRLAGDPARLAGACAGMVRFAAGAGRSGRVSCACETMPWSGDADGDEVLVLFTARCPDPRLDPVSSLAFGPDDTLGAGTNCDAQTLALGLCRRLWRLMGGDMYLESGECGLLLSAGALFRRTDAAGETALEADPGDSAPAPLRGLRVLLAEDSPVNAEIAEAVLEEFGISVTSVADGAEAVAACSTFPPPYDVVLMDVLMPRMNGRQAAEAIRALPLEAWELPIIAMTAHTDAAEIRACLGSGMNGAVFKPLDMQNLHSVLLAWRSPSPEDLHCCEDAAERLRRALLQSGPPAGAAYRDSSLARDRRRVRAALHQGRAEILERLVAAGGTAAAVRLLDRFFPPQGGEA